MKILGISIECRKCITVVLDDASGAVAVAKGITKFEVNDTESQEDLKTFYKTLVAFIRDESINLIFIKQRNKKGEYAGGAEGFKIEAIIQLVDVPVNFISANAIAAKMKKHDISTLKESVYNYQEDALKTAFVGSLIK